MQYIQCNNEGINHATYPIDGATCIFAAKVISNALYNTVSFNEK